MTTRMFWATMLATTCLLPGALHADGPLPTDPDVIAGDITISNPSPAQLLLEQSGAYGIVDWGSFSIGSGHGVQVNNGSGATLNRVTGNDLSSILGTLDATGSVYLINQNGIVFGASGVVNTGGTFVASTLDISNADFLDGGENVFAGQSDGYVINLGAVSSLGGDVAFLAHHVINEGSIDAPNGTVGLVVGREILMRDASLADGLFSVRIGGSDTSVTEAGSIRAAAAELRANGGNVYALAGNTSGTIAATGVARVKGRVFLTAGDGGRVKVEKTVKATAADGTGGAISVDGGHVDMSGVLDASGSAGGQVRITSRIATDFSGEILAFGDGTTGSGGFVEVSGTRLTFGGAVDTGGGTVLIDPDNIEIGPDGATTLGGATLIFASTVANLLLTQNVIIETTGTDGEAGTIAVTSPVVWSSGFGLSLLAHGDVIFTADVLGANGANGLNVVAGWNGSTSTTAFDPAAFLAADLTGTTLFGNDTGAGYTLGGGAFAASGSVVVLNAQVGVANGNTNVFANSVTIGGSGSTGPSQLGYNITNVSGVNPSGDIVVRATGDVNVVGGSVSDAAAQIGHVGVDFSGSSFAQTVNASGDIRIEAAGGVGLEGGGDDNAYAMIGHGSRDFFSFLGALGDRSGNITITAGGEVSIQTSTGFFSRDAWIGHDTGSGVVSGADITVTALNFDQDRSTLVGAGGTGSLAIGMLGETSQGGTVTYIATDSTAGAGLSLTGSTGSSACECNFATTTGDILVQSAGDLLLDSTYFFSNTGGGDLVLAAGADFQNNSGADAFGSMLGRWLIYSTRPDQNSGEIGTLTGVFIATDYAFDPNNPFDPARGSATPYAGNGLLYTAVPLVTVADATMTYGGALVLPDFAVTVDGVAVDPLAWGFSVDSIFVDDGIVTYSSTGNINAGTFVSALDFTWAPLASVTGGYDFLFVDFGDLTVDQAVLSASIIGQPFKVYDGTTLATLTAADFLLTGFVEGEDATIDQTAGAYATANAGTGIVVTANLAAGDFSAGTSTDLANYVLPTSASGLGDIGQATISGSVIGTPTKVYDGTTTALLTAADFQLTGFVAGEGGTIDAATGTYAQSDAGTGIAITVGLGAGDVTGTGTTNLANYILPASLSGFGDIDQAALTAAVIGTPTKVYDGTTTALLTAANFLLTGFAGDEGATIDVTSGTYASPNASNTNQVTVALTLGDFSVGSGTNLANYVLPVTASGNGVISQATLTGSIIGAPTKTYDGTTTATLTAANFLLTGFVTGEGATITGTTGTYATANATTGTTVSATLGAGDFAATGATLLANYILPTTVSGIGAIDRALLTAAIVGLPTKVFDGSTTATLTAANFLLSGFVTGEGATVTQTTGSYQTAAAGVSNTVAADLTAGDFAADSGTSLANYILPTRALGPGLIEGAPPFQPQIPEITPFETFTTTPLGQPSGPATGIEVINDETTQRILDEIRAGTAFCKALVRQEYVIDCLSDRLQSVADGLSAVGEYSEVRAALEDAARQLHSLALANASQDLAQQVMRAGGRRSSRPLTAVSTEAMGAVNAQAAAIIEGAELVLLRSSSGSERRAEAFTQVAQVVNSTKVLLRSS